MRRSLLLISVTALCLFSAHAGPAIDDVDRVRIAEAYRIGEKLQNKLWADWGSAPFAILFVTDEYEFLIRHRRPNDEFRSIGYDQLLKSEVFVRPRKFQKNFLATFPAFGKEPVIVVGKAENTSDKTSTRWVFVLLHEHFHQLQYARPDYTASVNALDLANGDTSGMWQLNYPFPYTDETNANQFRELTNKLLAAYLTANKAEGQSKLRDFIAAREEFFASVKSSDRRYASFQLWQEGIARYTQIKMAQLAAKELKPSKAFAGLADFSPFEREADRLHQMTLDEMRKLDLRTWQRIVYYPFGAIEGLLLDHVQPKWRKNYFVQKFELEKYYPPLDKLTCTHEAKSCSIQD